ncbi:DMT family transporter [Leptolyngbya sp. 15MV]|nr:DMT family transporter [Leptolyngbya sp. 15MV]
MTDSTITEAPARQERLWPRWVLLAALLAGNVALALGPWAVRLADSGPVAAGFWRLALALPFLALLARANGERLGDVRGPAMWPVLLAGVIFALDLASWHIGIELTRLGNATLFGNAGSLVLMVWAFVVLRRLPRGGEWSALVLALGGSAILLGRSLEISTTTLIGDLFCLLAGLFYAGYLLLLQGKRERLGSWTLLFWASFDAAWGRWEVAAYEAAALPADGMAGLAVKAAAVVRAVREGPADAEKAIAESLAADIARLIPEART